ncbi:DUF4421 family protein, partial [Cesiribacter andamanensis]|uniref:DUF4421 family protein n=1 Tax=Cesiribacter andamanensis TaxID=649507 RepID=UPI001267C9F6
MKLPYIFLSLLLLCGAPALAQKAKGEDSLRVRSGNFYYYPKMFAVRLIYQERRLPLTLSPLSDGREASYQPNSNRSIGIGGALVGISFSVSMALPKPFQRDPELYGSTTQRDLRLNAFAKRLGLQLDRQDYQGYYLNNVNQLDPAWKSQDGFPLRSDLRTRRLGVGISYLLRPDQFAYSVAFNNIRRQRIGGDVLFSGLCWPPMGAGRLPAA